MFVEKTKMEVKILSRETIIPSSPTPPHLKTFELSLLDQLSPIIYTPLLFFYPKNKKNEIEHQKHPNEAIASLKTSLSQSLSCFFLLAGRIIDKSIHCSDKGAMFTQATVNCNMSEILKKPNNKDLMKLLPCPVFCSASKVEELAQVVVQANIFNCGGIAISLCLLHKLMDGVTFSCFLRYWASISKGSFQQHCSSPNMICSNYTAFSSLFPQTNLLPFHQQRATPSSPNREADRENLGLERSDLNYFGKSTSIYKRNYKIQDLRTPCDSQAPSPSTRADGKRCLQRFVFREKAIRDLKAKSKSKEVPNPTTIETLTGFVWKHVMEAASTKAASTLSHVVKLRKRMEPPFDEMSVGNILWGTVAHCSTERKLKELVSLLRGSFAKVDSDYIKGLMGNEGPRAVLKLLGEINKIEDSSYYFCTSWRNMDLNEVDFGWGKPVWIGIAGDLKEMIGNVILFIDNALGDGVEVWMVLDQKEMQLLEKDSQFLEFALLNPSIDLL